MPSFVDLTGMRFGRLVIKRRGPGIKLNNARTRTSWHCLCDCGKTTCTSASSLRAGHVKSCGCLKLENLKRIGHAHKITDPEEKERRAKHNERTALRGRLRRTFGLKIEDYDAMLIAQKGKCKICGSEKKLSIDHCHKGGQVRSLLCLRCNMGIGMFGDDPAILASAKSYVEYWKEA